MSPSRSAASIIATPIRSFTDPPGFMYSSFTSTSPPTPSPICRRATIGVPPIVAETSGARVVTVGSERGLGVIRAQRTYRDAERQVRSDEYDGGQHTREDEMSGDRA